MRTAYEALRFLVLPNESYAAKDKPAKHAFDYGLKHDSEDSFKLRLTATRDPCSGVISFVEPEGLSGLGDPLIVDVYRDQNEEDAAWQEVLNEAKASIIKAVRQ